MTLQDVKKKIPAIQRQLNGGQKKIVVIDGPSGPTGKTTAARLLTDAGIPVYEGYQVLRITVDGEPERELSAISTDDLVKELLSRGCLRVSTIARTPYQLGHKLVQTGYGHSTEIKAQTVLVVPPFSFE